MPLYARLDKTGWRISCAVCGWKFGAIGTLQELAEPVGPRRGSVVTGSDPLTSRPIRLLAAFPMSWAPGDRGVWHETPRGKKMRQQQGYWRERRAVQRHDPFATLVLRTTGAPLSRHRLPHAEFWLAPWDLPVDALSNRCQAQNVIDADTLGVDSNPKPATDLMGQTSMATGAVVFLPTLSDVLTAKRDALHIR